MLMLEAPITQSRPHLRPCRCAHQRADGRGASTGGRGEVRPFAGQGDPNADSEWQRAVASLQRLGRAISDDSHQAEELAQQALAQVLERAPDRALHAGYLRKTLIRIWLDQRRSARRELRRRAMLAAERISRAVGARLDHQEELDRVRTAMKLLPPRQRAALAMRLVEQLSYQAIADAMGTDIRAARANVHLARTRLRAMLEDQA